MELVDGFDLVACGDSVEVAPDPVTSQGERSLSPMPFLRLSRLLLTKDSENMRKDVHSPKFHEVAIHQMGLLCRRFIDSE